MCAKIVLGERQACRCSRHIMKFQFVRRTQLPLMKKPKFRGFACTKSRAHTNIQIHDMLTCILLCAEWRFFKFKKKYPGLMKTVPLIFCFY